MKWVQIFFITCICLILTGCKSQPHCPNPAGVLDPTLVEQFEPLANTSGFADRPSEVTLGRKTIAIDHYISGPLCNDNWSGTVYVACDVQVAKWEEEPLFFKSCNLVIDPETVVYVAAHGATPYYKGCSCHIESQLNE